MSNAAVIEAIDRTRADALGLQRARQIKTLEAQLHQAFVEHFIRERSDAVRALSRWSAQFPAQEAMAERDVMAMMALLAAAQSAKARSLVRRITPALWKAFVAGHSTSGGALRVSVRFTVAQKRAMAWARAHAAELVKGINKTTRDRVAALIRSAINDGWSYSRTEGELKRLYDDFRGKTPPRAQRPGYRSRARLIAVNEASIAYSEGEMELARWLEDGGIAMEKASLTTGSDRVCEICLGNEGEGWIPLGDSFGDGSEQPPFHVGCECVLEVQRAGATTR